LTKLKIKHRVIKIPIDIYDLINPKNELHTEYFSELIIKINKKIEDKHNENNGIEYLYFNSKSFFPIIIPYKKTGIKANKL
jgi:hypothetical protein